VLDTTLDLGDGTKATLKVVELPELGQMGDAEANIFPHNSGFYVVRNGREIISGETFGFYRHHHSYSHFRAELAYHGESTAFHEDIKKASIHPDDRLKERLNKLTKSLIEQSGRRGRERGEDRVPVLATKTADLINAKLAAASDKSEEAKASKKSDNGKAEEKAAPQVEFSTVPADGKGRYFHAEQKDGKLSSTTTASTRSSAGGRSEAAGECDAPRPDLLQLGEGRVEAKGDCSKLMKLAGEYLAVLATQSLRAKFPSMGQRTLARRIVNRDFTDQVDRTTAGNTGSRSYASTYATIRRYDAAAVPQLA
jgi:hypothetical protein